LAQARVGPSQPGVLNLVTRQLLEDDLEVGVAGRVEER
jgi:hypothetical protein